MKIKKKCQKREYFHDEIKLEQGNLLKDKHERTVETKFT